MGTGSEGRPMRIFYVDDDENDRLLLAKAVRKAELPIVLDTADSGRAALATLTKKTALPDLLLLDIKMPEMSGFDLFGALKAAGVAHIPVVMFSSSSEARDVQRAKDMGAHAYCVKPTGLDEIVEFIKGIYWGWVRQQIPCEWPEQTATRDDRRRPR